MIHDSLIKTSVCLWGICLTLMLLELQKRSTTCLSSDRGQKQPHRQGMKVLPQSSTYLFFSSEEASMSLNSPAMWTIPQQVITNDKMVCNTIYKDAKTKHTSHCIFLLNKCGDNGSQWSLTSIGSVSFSFSVSRKYDRSNERKPG